MLSQRLLVGHTLPLRSQLCLLASSFLLLASFCFPVVNECLFVLVKTGVA